MAEAVKTCPKCRVTKQLTDFSIRKSGRVGHAVSWCKRCSADATNARLREMKKRDPTIYRRLEWPSKLRRLYGITVDDYHNLFEVQGKCCAICKSETPGNRTVMFHVDHCHKTKKVRGLLCTKCNIAIGLLKDSPEIAINLANYLRKGHPFE